MTSPWKTLSSRRIYSNRWMTVREDRVVHPDSTEGIYGVVSPVSFAVAVVALSAREEVALVGQYRYPTSSYGWEIPAGGGKRDETPLAAAQRELREEVQLSAKHWLGLPGKIQTNSSITDEFAYIFLARDLAPDESTQADPEEFLQRKSVPFRTALEMVDAGEIEHSLSVIGLVRVARMLGIA